MKTTLHGLLFWILVAAVRAQDVCTPNPCMKNGACFVDPLNEEFGYFCVCPQGFQGQNCQEDTNECDPNPCQNDANCRDGFLTFSCDCPPGFNGEKCEFALAALSFPPVLVTATASSMMTNWTIWNPEIDRGDPPVVGYIPYYREASSEEWISGAEIPPGEPMEFGVEGLKPDTVYEFSVAAVREGDDGVGPKSPSVSLRTKCDVSLEDTPYNVRTILNTATKHLNVSWQNPDNIMCSAGITLYSIYYKNERSNSEVLFLTRAEADMSWIIIDINVLGEGRFSFFVSLTVESESDLSSGSEEIVITGSDLQEVPDSSGPSIVVIFIIIIILVVAVSICIFALRYQKKRRSN